MATTTTRRRRFLPLVDLSMRELCLSLGTSPSLVVVVVSMPISPVVVVVVVSVSAAATVINIISIVSGRTMVSLAVVLVLLVVSLVIAVVIAARHDEKKFLFLSFRGEMLCDDQERAQRAECEKEKKRIHDEIAFFQSKLEKVQQDEKSNQRKKSEEMTREPAEVIELDSE